jgi:hypothetical protein
MKYRILSGRMAWPAGTEVDASDLSGNIDVLVQAGHVTPVVAGKMNVKSEPVQPDPVDDDSAEEPEEQD